MLLLAVIINSYIFFTNASLPPEIYWLKCLQAIRGKHNALLSSKLENIEESTILLVDPANHNNFGDTMLSQAEEEFLASLPHKFNLETCRLVQAHNRVPTCGDFSRYTSAKMAIFHAGGNWGDIWRSPHKTRLKAMSVLLTRKIPMIGFPQSYHFGNTNLEREDADFIKNSLIETVGLDQGKKYITLLWRQQNSYDRATEMYPFVENLLSPDIAFQLGPYIGFDRYPASDYQPEEKYDIVILLRIDKESVVKGKGPDVVQSTLNSLPGGRNIKFIFGDWPSIASPAKYYHHMSNPLGKQDSDLDYDTRLQEAANYYSLGKVIITDRLHGSILAFLHYKPHIFIDNSYKKVSKTREVAFRESQYCQDTNKMRYSSAADLKDALMKAIEMLKYYA